jgi:hypothetical protein
MEVTTGQIIVSIFVMMFVGLSGIIGAIAVSAQKGGDWEGKN